MMKYLPEKTDASHGCYYIKFFLKIFSDESVSIKRLRAT